METEKDTFYCSAMITTNRALCKAEEGIVEPRRALTKPEVYLWS